MRPPTTAPHKTLYNRFIRWSEAGVFDRVFSELAAGSVATDTVMIPSRGLHANRFHATDATHLKTRRAATSLLKKGPFPGVSAG